MATLVSPGHSSSRRALLRQLQFQDVLTKRGEARRVFLPSGNERLNFFPPHIVTVLLVVLQPKTEAFLDTLPRERRVKHGVDSEAKASMREVLLKLTPVDDLLPLPVLEQTLQQLRVYLLAIHDPLLGEACFGADPADLDEAHVAIPAQFPIIAVAFGGCLKVEHHRRFWAL